LRQVEEIFRGIRRLLQHELRGVFGEVGRIAVSGQQTADTPAQVRSDAFSLSPVQLRHPLDHLGQLASHQAEQRADVSFLSPRFRLRQDRSQEIPHRLAGDEDIRIDDHRSTYGNGRPNHGRHGYYR